MPNRSAVNISEWATLFPSPTKASVRPRRSPNCSCNVNTSASAWQGWYRSLSALITGTLDHWASPSIVCWENTRATMALVQRSRFRATSLSGSRSPIGPMTATASPPNCLMASTKRRLFEQQAEITSGERTRITRWVRFHLFGEIEQRQQFVVAEIEVALKVASGDFRRHSQGCPDSGHFVVSTPRWLNVYSLL